MVKFDITFYLICSWIGHLIGLEHWLDWVGLAGLDIWLDFTFGWYGDLAGLDWNGMEN